MPLRQFLHSRIFAHFNANLTLIQFQFYLIYTASVVVKIVSRCFTETQSMNL